MINKEIASYINEYSDSLRMVNKLIVAAYLKFNDIEVNNNKLIISYLQGNEKNKVDAFNNLIKKQKGKFDFEDLIQVFEITIPSKDVSVNGAVYTPKYIKDYIVTESFKSIPKDKTATAVFADIACGSGAFLYTIAEQIHTQTKKEYSKIFHDNIYGLDISDYSIERTKILLSLLAITNGEDNVDFQFNLSTGNALDFNWEKEYATFKGFDGVVGNPPYVRAKHLSSETKSLMSNWKVTKSGNPDLYIPFFEIGLNYLKPDGILGYITVNTFKRSVNARNLRNYFKNNRLNVSILDFGSQQIFDNKLTYTCIVFVGNNKTEEVKYKKVTPEEIKRNEKLSFSKINYRLLNTHKGWLLNENKVLENIHKIENAGVAIGKKYPIKNGLATLSNYIFIFKPVDEDNKYYYHQNGKLYKIEKGICRDVIKPNRLKA